MSKRLLIIDNESNALDIAMRAQWAGWKVKWYDKARKDGTQRQAGLGIVEKIEDWGEVRSKWLDWADLIYLPDNNTHIEVFDQYRTRGLPILAPSLEAAALELDRDVGQKALAKAGIRTIPSKAFYDYDSAIGFVKRNPLYLVSKPSGDASKALSYVAHDPADLIYMLGRWKKRPELVAAARKCGFILQERKYGVEMAVGGWFNGFGFSKWFYENFEYKKLMDGDLGVNTGEMGTLSRMVTRSKLAKQVLLPMAAQLESLKYRGFIDVNCIIDETGPWPMEFTMRDGWPTRHNITAHIKNEDPIQWMLDLVHGQDTIQCVNEEVCVSVVIALPDFPYSRITNKELCGIPVRNANDPAHIHLSEVKIGVAPVMVGDTVVDMPGLVTAGDYVMVVTGVGASISKARREAYDAVRKVRIPNSPFYRTDIGMGRMKKQLAELHRWGYAQGLEI